MQEKSSQSKIKLLPIDRVTAIEKKMFDENLGFFVFGQNDPFSIIEDENFKAFLSAIRPGYKIPDFTELSTNILDKCEAKLLSQLEQKCLINATLIITKDTGNQVFFQAMPRFGNGVFLSSCQEPQSENEWLEKATDAVELCLRRYNLQIDSCMKYDSVHLDDLCIASPLANYSCTFELGTKLIRSIQNISLNQEIEQLFNQLFENQVLMHAVQAAGGGDFNSCVLLW